jgi:hypothetical protein
MVMKYYYFSVGNTHKKSLDEALAPHREQTSSGSSARGT